MWINKTFHKLSLVKQTLGNNSLHISMNKGDPFPCISRRCRITVRWSSSIFYRTNSAWFDWFFKQQYIAYTMFEFWNVTIQMLSLMIKAERGQSWNFEMLLFECYHCLSKLKQDAGKIDWSKPFINIYHCVTSHCTARTERRR